MPLLVDAYNVLHTVGVLPPDLAGVDVPGLVRLIAGSRYRNERVELVCDGSPRPDVPPGKVGGVIIRYAGPGREADAAIAAAVRHSSAPRRLTVVSSDQQVLRAARKRKCATLTSQQFLHQLAADARPGGSGSSASASSKPPGGLTNRQIEAWLSIFGVDETDESLIEPPAKKPVKGESQQTKGKEPAPSEKSKRRPGHRGETIPRDLINEAERLWAQQGPTQGASPEDTEDQ